jgi:hypothetical protein
MFTCTGLERPPLPLSKRARIGAMHTIPVNLNKEKGTYMYTYLTEIEIWIYGQKPEANILVNCD